LRVLSIEEGQVEPAMEVCSMTIDCEQEADAGWLARTVAARRARACRCDPRSQSRLRQLPQHVRGRKLRAELHFRCGQRDEGCRDAMAAVEIDPSNTQYGLDCAFNLISDGSCARSSHIVSYAGIAVAFAFTSPLRRRRVQVRDRQTNRFTAVRLAPGRVTMPSLDL
jgi:hypothetical protein